MGCKRLSEYLLVVVIFYRTVLVGCGGGGMVILCVPKNRSCLVLVPTWSKKIALNYRNTYSFDVKLTKDYEFIKISSNRRSRKVGQPAVQFMLFPAAQQKIFCTSKVAAHVVVPFFWRLQSKQIDFFDLTNCFTILG